MASPSPVPAPKPIAAAETLKDLALKAQILSMAHPELLPASQAKFFTTLAKKRNPPTQADFQKASQPLFDHLLAWLLDEFNAFRASDFMILKQKTGPLDLRVRVHGTYRSMSQAPLASWINNIGTDFFAACLRERGIWNNFANIGQIPANLLLNPPSNIAALRIQLHKDPELGKEKIWHIVGRLLYKPATTFTDSRPGRISAHARLPMDAAQDLLKDVAAFWSRA